MCDKRVTKKRIYAIKPLTFAPETVAINSTPDSGASFSCRCTTPNVVDCLCGPRRQSTTLGVGHRHEKLAPESGIKVRPMAPISGACVKGFVLVDVLVLNEVVGQGGEVGAVRRGEATVGDDELELRVPQHRSIHITGQRLATHYGRREAQLTTQTASGRPTAAGVTVARHHELARLVHHTTPIHCRHAQLTKGMELWI